MCCHSTDAVCLLRCRHCSKPWRHNTEQNKELLSGAEEWISAWAWEPRCLVLNYSCVLSFQICKISG